MSTSTSSLLTKIKFFQESERDIYFTALELGLKKNDNQKPRHYLTGTILQLRILLVGLFVILIYGATRFFYTELLVQDIGDLQEPVVSTSKGHQRILNNQNRSFNDTEKMDFVRKMMAHAWNGYMEHAKGYDELDTVNLHHNWYGNDTLLSTPIDAMDTLYIMDMHKEFQEAKELSLSLNLEIDAFVSVFETNIRIVGGFLAAYEQDSDPKLLQMAQKTADKLLNAFIGPHYLPLNFVNLLTGKSRDHKKLDSVICLAEYGTLQLEFQYLSDVTGEAKYQDAVLNIYKTLETLQSAIPGLYPLDLDINKMSFVNDIYTVSALGDSYYEYLLKIWVSTKHEPYRSRYDGAANAILDHLLVSTERWTYLTTIFSASGPKDNILEHLTCFAGGMFSLGAISHASKDFERHFDVAHKLTESCYNAYTKEPQSIGFERYDVAHKTYIDPSYHLRPELIESLVYLWRFTHDPIYREWGWEIAQKIERVCKTSKGYSTASSSVQESFFLSETLKYLFLLFTDDDILPFDEFVFNTEGHAISIRGFGKRVDPLKWVPIQ